ncbi:MAG: DUF4329 domain-containing protein [Gammaproteobacteria bacterium]
MFRSTSTAASLLLLAMTPDLPALASLIAYAEPAQTGREAGYRDAESAVAAAANAHNPRSIRDDREYLGAILLRDGRYSWVAAAGIPGRDRISVRLRRPAGATVVAFWHTHGGPAYERRYFSDTDTRLVRKWRLPLYLADHTGQLRVFSPGDRTMSSARARRLGLPARSGFALGKRVVDRDGEPIRIATVIDELADSGVVLLASASSAPALR